MKAFDALIENAKKRNYAEYLHDNMNEEREQVIKGIKFEKELDSNFRKALENEELEWVVKTVPEDMLEWANEELNKGNVAAVDGTNMYPIDLISGVFCQVGVGGLSYTNDEPSINVQSITSHITEDTNAGEYFGDLIFGEEKKLSRFDITSAMIYWELEHCLHKEELWVFKDGNIIPYELIVYGSGRDLLSEMFPRVNIPLGVIKSSKSPKYRLLGRFLRPKEYMIIENTKEFYVQSFKTDARHGGYRLKEQKFLDEYASRVKRGLFKAKYKSYVFEIHEDILDSGIALIMADSMRNPRGLLFWLI